MAGQDSGHGGSGHRAKGQKGRHFGAGGRQSHSRGRGNQRQNMGRQEYFRNKQDKRERNDEAQSKRLRLDDNGSWVTADGPFTKEEIEAEDRRPKRKVAVMIGYSGTGYKGMQIMPDQPTIEGDLFKAMIAAGAISKANASDPKKNSLVRCARTDKGVHAAGNVISLKLIVEDEDIVSKINEHLPQQIRVWGIERTLGSFSCYQACDSRWYEYLLPTYCFLPPHPTSFLGKELDRLAEERQDIDGYKERQREVEQWWAQAEQEFIKPVLEELDEDVRKEVSQAMYKVHGISASLEKPWESDNEDDLEEDLADEDNTTGESHGIGAEQSTISEAPANEVTSNQNGEKQGAETVPNLDEWDVIDKDQDLPETDEQSEFRKRVVAATKRLRQAYIAAKASYRLSPQRLSRIQETLSQFTGTLNHHNYTVKKSPKDPSARRHIKSFGPVTAPSSSTETGTYLIGGTEWLSIKVHGQSFMMHQIRKMIGMAALVVRCGCDPSIIRKSLSDEIVIAVPKAPSLGLLLERPVFDSYNSLRASKFGRESVTFDKYETEMNAFKEKEIYQRIYAQEEKEHVFHTFFSQIDEYKNTAFLYLSSAGFDAVPSARKTTSKPIEKGNRHRSKPRPSKETNPMAVDKDDAEAPSEAAYHTELQGSSKIEESADSKEPSGTHESSEAVKDALGEEVTQN